MTQSWVTYTNRMSPNYRFSTTDRNDPKIAELRDMVKNYWKPRNIKSYSVRVRPRGQRDGNYYETPLKNATHFDIYIKENYYYS